ncbi:hypothetical protein HMPREF3152_11060 [Actinomyces sp. HMSC06A08]|uniref:MFS transporter n=2 Tax=Winkia neuii TaxID=33007 RepID=A0A2I1IM61_9ACTO|nr:hypothetical protein HMPREF2851_08830 [Actinomyces sp. HMSC064C12]OFK02447.1 hypothetical protein HMPREF2835_06825 [Actinomyces sp. HMSC072A03]OFT53901.1 hypothetical protein HMPREF3152_11060 [Actinomyces sp. HMSC06A08]PKY72182.1 MFS transporter [Winkia neuii]
MSAPRYFTVPGSSRRYDRNRILIATLAPLVMALLQVSSVNTLLPAVQSTLGASTSGIQWVLAGYALVYGIVLVPAGRIGDLVGRALMFVIGLLIFCLACIGCSVAGSIFSLNLMRLLQAVGAGVFSPQVTGMIQQYFKADDRARAYGMMGLTIAASVAAGPLISGIMVACLGDDPGWRYTFALNAPLGLAGIGLALRWLPFSKERRTIGAKKNLAAAQYRSAEAAAGRNPNKERGTKLDLDPVGMLLLCGGIFLIMIPFTASFSGRYWLLPLALVVLGAWTSWEYLYERAGHIPMVELKLFKISSFSYCITISALQFLGSTSIFVLLALYLQQGLEKSALFTGLIGLPNAAISGIASVWSAKRALKQGGALQVGALATIIISVLATIAIAYPISAGCLAPAWIAVPITPLGIGLGIMGSVNTTQAMVDVPVAHGGTAGGIAQTSQRIATAIGNTVVTAAFFAAGAKVGAPRTGWLNGFTIANLVVVAFVLASTALATTYWRRQKA